MQNKDSFLNYFKVHRIKTNSPCCNNLLCETRQAAVLLLYAWSVLTSLYSSWYVAFVFLYKMPSFRFNKAITKKEDFSFRIHIVEEMGI